MSHKYNESKTKNHKYSGWFYKFPEKEFYRWNEFSELGDGEDELMKSNNFESFCQRMWLDNCDENLDLAAQGYTYDKYISKYKDWLLERFEERNGIS